MKHSLTKKCERCGKNCSAWNSKQKYCGSYLKKTGCSYEVRQNYLADFRKRYYKTEAYKDTVKRFREKNPGYTRTAARLARKLAKLTPDKTTEV